uniref:Uncharacterized protein n=1 Tax=Anguilla anguilla TaxID=7936 RepID=A0A0E9T7B3_ANGAN
MMFLARLKMATTGVNRSQHIFDSEADQEEINRLIPGL